MGDLRMSQLFKVLRVVACCLVVAMSMSATCRSALAQPATEALVADLATTQGVRSMLSTKLADDFARLIAADEVQQAAAADLISAARAALDGEINRLRRAERDGDEDKVAGKRAIEATRATERSLLEDLRAVARSDQREGVDRFERLWRRRAILPLAPGSLDIDVIATIESLSPEQAAKAKVPLIEAETELDVAIVNYTNARTQRRRVLQAQNKPNDQEKARLQQRASDAADELQRAKSRVWRNLFAAMPSEVKEQLLLRRATVLSRSFSRDGGGPSGQQLPPRVQEVLALNLRSQQRADADRMVGQAHIEYMNLLQAWAEGCDDELLLKKSPEATNRFLEQRTQLRERLSAEVFALLDEAQRDAYERSPIIEPPVAAAGDAE